ncbi:MAG: hypothetical protein ACO1N5_16685, partial [Noviherbaspirillum sp.]
MMLHALRDAAHTLQDADGIVYGDKLSDVIHVRKFSDIHAPCLVVHQPQACFPVIDFPDSLVTKCFIVRRAIFDVKPYLL